ncbi:hypothetical protein ACFQ4C_25600 [Larkinella insperata]|uniref:Uncharacterized protein n=1 Tax=Larkinella insperata TaxID=332158 RepID=A0ABW3QDM7_9BACT|nr:hypothetical protein [Larkinella insperata]
MAKNEVTAISKMRFPSAPAGHSPDCLAECLGFQAGSLGIVHWRGAVPFACLIFFCEINAPECIALPNRQTSIYGRYSLHSDFAAVLQQRQFLSSWLAASSAGMVEEYGKLLTVLALIHGY